MQTVVLVSCGKAKKEILCTAEEMYTSIRFQLAKEYSIIIGDIWYIVSAKYGLLQPDQVIEPYDVWLNDFSSIEKRKWCDKVKSILHEFSYDTKFIILLNDRYAHMMIQMLSELKFEYTWPLKNVDNHELEKYFLTKLDEFA